MPEPDTRDYMDIGTPGRGKAGKSAASWVAPVLVVAAGLACVGGVYFWGNALFGRNVGAKPEAAAPGANNDDVTKRRITAFVEQFLMAYYNYSYSLYDQSVSKAEGMMTPSFQAAYNQRALDLDFKRKLAAYKVSTDGVKILPGSMAFSNEGDRYYVRLAGTMTFSTGSNGVSGDFPLTLLIALEKTESGFLVDNVERLR